MNKNRFEWEKWIPICIIAVILMIVYKTLDSISPITAAVGGFFRVISPLFYGVLFTYFFYTPHSKIEKLFSKSRLKFFSKRARGFSTLTVFFLLVLVIVLIISFIMPIMITSVIDLADSIPTYITVISDFINNVPENSVLYSLNLADTIKESSGRYINQIINLARIEQIARGLISVAGEVFRVVLGLIMSMYMLLERDKIVEFFKRLNTAVFKNEKARIKVSKFFKQVNDVLFTFIASKGLDSIINMITVTLMLLIFNVPYAILLGLIAGLFNFIPYLGSLIAVILITAITLITGGLSKAIQVAVPLLVFQQLDGNFIEPKIMHSSLKVSPILVIIAVVTGGAYFGIAGMFLAVPVVAIIKQVLTEYVSPAELE